VDLSPLRIRDFRLLFGAAGVSSFGSMITYVTIPFQIKELTGDPLMVGLVGLCELAPLLIMAFVGGALADYLDRRKLVFWSEVGFALLTVILLVNALLGTPQIWILFVIAALAGAIDGIQRPAMDAIIPRLAPAEKMPAVAALTSLRWQAAQIGVPGGRLRFRRT
jgi:MFS family permease